MRAKQIAPLLIAFIALSAFVSRQPQFAAVNENVARADSQASPIFIFHTDEFWLNLHHFLYVLGRAQNKTFDSSREAVVKAPADQAGGLATLTATERIIWSEAVAAYAATWSKKDLVFDERMPAMTKALATAVASDSLAGTEIDAEMIAILERAAPLYRKAWWPRHQEANLAWLLAMKPLLDQHGTRILNFIRCAYMLSWPEAGYAVHVSAYTNWAGAYSTRGDLLVLASLSEPNRGLHGLETVFHEGMHQWDSQVAEALGKEAAKQNKVVPQGLSHALIFFTAGEAIRRGAPQHVPYAEKFGVWQRGFMRFKQPLEQAWKPYLDGNGPRDEAFAELIRLVGESKP